MSEARTKGTPPDSHPGFRALEELFEGGRPLIYICSPEETRVRMLLEEAATRLFPEPLPLWTWSSTAGLQGSGHDSRPQDLDARAVLDFIASGDSPGIFHLLDFHEFTADSAGIRRRLRDLYDLCVDRNRFVVISAPVRSVPEELARQMSFVELPPPDLGELTWFLRRETDHLRGQGHAIEPGEDFLFSMVRALQGLTFDESRHALRRVLKLCSAVDARALPLLVEEKKHVVNKSGLVEYVADGTQVAHVGGLDYLKKWLLDRRKLFVERESLNAEIVPKGVLIMGVSGCGKSLSVKAIAACFGLPLYRIDMIEVFSGRHGGPDAAFVTACRTLESLAPAVVWFDEIEMGLTASAAEASTNIGRIFAFFLTWMQEKARGLFVAATANRIDLLPAEMIRKGRFDEVFFIDLPGEEERDEIFRIHLQKRGIDPEPLEIHRLRRITQGWSGAEIEQCVVSAITEVRLEDRSMTFEDLHRAAQNVIPLSRTMREQVDHIRSWAYERAVRASPRETQR